MCSGSLIAYWLARGIISLAPDDLPRVAEIAVNAPVALFTLAVVVAVAVLSGRRPACARGTGDSRERARRQPRHRGPSALRARSTLLVVQIGLSIVLMVAAGLVLRSFHALTRVDLGFVSTSVLSATVQPQAISQPPNTWLDQFLRRVRTLPGVEAAGAVYLRPLMLGPIGQGVRVRLEGQPETRDAADANPTLNHQIASTGYFEAMNIPLRAGRFFTDHDTGAAPRVAIVSESTARRLWPGQNPIGKRISMASFTPGAPPQMWRTVVGVVSDVRYRGLQEVQLDVYDAALQTGRPADNIVVRTAGDPMGMASAIRADRARARPDRRSSTTSRRSMPLSSRAEAPWRLTMWLFVLFAGLAFASVGVRAVRARRARRRPASARVRDSYWRSAPRARSSCVGC